MYELDAAITGWVNSLSGNSFLDHVVITVSNIGVPLLILAVAAQWWSGSERTKTRHILIAAGLTFLLGLGINQIILLFEHRIRPPRKQHADHACSRAGGGADPHT